MLAFSPTIRTFCECMAPLLTALVHIEPTAPLSYSISTKALSSSGARERQSSGGSTSDGDVEVRRHRFGDKQRMGGQIAQHIAGSGILRRDAPAGGFRLQLDGFIMKTVGELHIDNADLAEQPSAIICRACWII
jgi:hypothetical protein